MEKLIEQYKQADDYEVQAALRLQIIQKGRAQRLTYKELAALLGHTPGYVAVLNLYKGSRCMASTKEEVKRRDGYKCTNCPSRKMLDVHHIGASTDHSSSNLVTLCRQCHAKAERIRKARRVEIAKKAVLAREAKKKKV